MKKGQLFGEGFKIIFILVIIGMSLFFGFKAIGYVLDYSQEIQFNTFLVNLRGEIDKIGVLDQGSSVRLKSLNIPGNLDEVCFFDNTYFFNEAKVDNELFGDAIGVYIEIEADYNVYFYFNGEIKYDKLDLNLNLDSDGDGVFSDHPLCDDTSDGSLDFRLIRELDGVYLGE